MMPQRWMTDALLIVSLMLLLGGCSGERPNDQEDLPAFKSIPLPAVEAAPEALASPAPGGSDQVQEKKPDRCTIAIDGAIKQPGLYEVDGNIRIWGLLREAGGVTEDADLYDINIAAPLIDGSTLHIPRLAYVQRQEGQLLVQKNQSLPAPINIPEYTCSGWASSAGHSGTSPLQTGTGSGGTGGGKIALNTASQEALETLPGIGPKTAEKIIAHRSASPFQRVEDLLNVHGIGPKKMAAIKPLVCVE